MAVIIGRTRPYYPVRISKQRFHSENASNVFCPHYAGGIWKRNNHRPFCICVCVKLEQGNHMTIVTSSFTKSFVFKMFSVHTEECFRKVPFSRRISVDGRPNRRNKSAFSNFSGVVWTDLSCLDKMYFSLPIRGYSGVVCHLILVCPVVIIPDEALLL